MKAQILLILTLLTGLSVQAQNFEQDLGFLRAGLQIWNFSDTGMEDFLDPYKGAQEFRLDEKHAPWAGNYFPMRSGGIAQRWQTPDDNRLKKFNDLPTIEDYMQMKAEQIAKLSPAEKYDLLKSQYDLPLTRFELENRGPLRETRPAVWEGFCNGVRCAGINLPEPKNAIEVMNADGIKIRFEPADLKALAGASYFYVEKYAQLGGPSPEGARQQNPANAAVFDLALRYFLGNKQKAFVIDSHLGDEVWNESVVGFKRNVGRPQKLSQIEQRAVPDAVSKVKVTGYIETLGEMSIEDSNGSTKAKVASGEALSTAPISYELYLDKNGRAIDGQWTYSPRAKRGVDFAWFGGGKGSDREYSRAWATEETLDFKRLQQLFRQSQVKSCSSVYSH